MDEDTFVPYHLFTFTVTRLGGVLPVILARIRDALGRRRHRRLSAGLHRIELCDHVAFWRARNRCPSWL
jgi:hypothetical protein